MGAWEDAVDDLYGGPLGDFVARRDAAARAARTAGDRDLAARVAALRKPTVAAWAVNLLVRDDPSLADQVRAVGEGLREAERTLDGPALRELTTQRRKLVAGLAQQARRLASAAGQKVSDAAAQEVERTLTAALLDPAAAQAVTSGALTHAQEHVGFGATPDTPDPDGAARAGSASQAGADAAPGRRAVTDDATAPDRAATPAAVPAGRPATPRTDDATARRAEQERVRAERDRERAERERARAAEALAAAEDTLAQARTRHDDAARADQDARRDLEDAQRASEEAYRAEEELVRALADVRRRLAEARSALPRADERLVAAQQHARQQEKAVRAAQRTLDRAASAADRARARAYGAEGV
ncbi:hypothetical protein [Cellulomonas oligotrophica]|uniref:Uncharacterized protein n=1 Tax=Cellulomonas oligotrophica TaxID=931536 RepID=A0A7Y9FGM7_9CELL|nr:hypothetical protein [Cellulomonas oligotrophica]NYD86980.1 hypothetical protein [Cellulomonas oligotrophica]GIG32234.1 hypothetical protein Col01nite_13930 [Cellulomonas oligotrophica]